MFSKEMKNLKVMYQNTACSEWCQAKITQCAYFFLSNPVAAGSLALTGFCHPGREWRDPGPREGNMVDNLPAVGHYCPVKSFNCNTSCCSGWSKTRLIIFRFDFGEAKKGEIIVRAIKYGYSLYLRRV